MPRCCNWVYYMRYGRNLLDISPYMTCMRVLVGNRHYSESMGAVRYCGNSTLPHYSSAAHGLMIRFRSDGAVNDQGFQLNYRVKRKMSAPYSVYATQHCFWGPPCSLHFVSTPFLCHACICNTYSREYLTCTNVVEGHNGSQQRKSPFRAASNDCSRQQRRLCVCDLYAQVSNYFFYISAE